MTGARSLEPHYRGSPLWPVKLMGHASKQMVYEVYGNYVDGLEEDAERIMDYFGRDFVIPQKNKSPILLRDSTGDRVVDNY